MRVVNENLDDEQHAQVPVFIPKYIEYLPTENVLENDVKSLEYSGMYICV